MLSSSLHVFLSTTTTCMDIGEFLYTLGGNPKSFNINEYYCTDNQLKEIVKECNLCSPLVAPLMIGQWNVWQLDIGLSNDHVGTFTTSTLGWIHGATIVAPKVGHAPILELRQVTNPHSLPSKKSHNTSISIHWGTCHLQNFQNYTTMSSRLV